MKTGEKKGRTLGQKFSLGFSIFCIIFLTLKFTGLLDTIIESFK
ncbi:hypothetical protein [Priestia taiwanensis]|uniref:Uncharacterized protein n=1 Tax=Priestia taiwanensis TaxID=1347902 RepID=A0A917ERT5_9BACI|nr:hypothetical protein [Priestia taiwanensis]MBM7365067.1 hypothetical protein [Priestia taiwanensis]GGE83808.1 hypothetical protein GCM10007140_36660 [Priestia taiwanensis]